MPRLNNTRLRILRAAQRGDLRHSVYQGYDWIDLGADDGGRVTVPTQAALRAGQIELTPRQRGDEHHGQAYRLTEAGAKVLAEANGK